MSNTIITGRDPLSGRALSLVVNNGVIDRVQETADANDIFLAPGLVDMQVNGCAGFDVNAPNLTSDTIAGLAEAMLARGVTCFAPTIITAPEQSICRALAAIAEARRKYPKVALCIPFAHIEGPHISPFDGYRGAHPVDAVRPPDLAEFDRWQQAGEACIGMVTLSPHYADAARYIAELVKRGVHVAIGHTHASPEQIQKAVHAGARVSTHLGNGIAAEVPRHINPIWPQLADDRITATFIADGHHLALDILKVMLRVKGAEHSILVSDSVALAGLPTGTYATPIGGHVELRPDGRVCILGSDLLAGATASLAECVGNLVRTTDVPLHQALRMATKNPGKFAGNRGELIPGARADVLRFRWHDQVAIEDVWLAGERVYSRTDAATRQEAVP